MVYTGNYINDVIQDMGKYTAVYMSDDGKTMYTARDIAQLIKLLYFNFKINADNDDDINAMIEFISYNYRTEITRMYDVLNATYNPIENYNKTATITDSGNADSTNYNVPVDTISEKETSKTSVTNGNTHTEHVSGNIGTMSTQNMIQQELEIRTLNNIKMFVVARFKEFYIWS